MPHIRLTPQPRLEMLLNPQGSQALVKWHRGKLKQCKAGPAQMVISDRCLPHPKRSSGNKEPATPETIPSAAIALQHHRGLLSASQCVITSPRTQIAKHAFIYCELRFVLGSAVVHVFPCRSPRSVDIYNELRSKFPLEWKHIEEVRNAPRISAVQS
ncbi:hypothetical protein LIA77_05835 [Sarocladium implicatum]|nr:hypothetical protein LIA77_05835 [Sarocladium implicatum]